MKTLISIGAFAASLLVVTPAIAQRGPGYQQQQQQAADDARFDAAQQRFDREYQLYQQEVQRYRMSRRTAGNDPRYDPRSDPRYNGGRWDDRDEGDYDAAKHYRSGPRYQERVLRADERVYRGRDGQYYCKRSDGTTGLIVGAVAGGVLGNAIDGGHSRTAGTLLGALVGGIVGQQVDQNSQQVRCR